MREKIICWVAIPFLITFFSLKKSKESFFRGTSKNAAEFCLAKNLEQTDIVPDVTWNDVDGKVINAHSGGILYENGFYYWYGEHKIPGKSENQGYVDGGMHCYRSSDLINWKDFGIVLPVNYNDSNSEISYGCIFQRPKVVYNSFTHKYVAFFKLYDKKTGYNICYTGLAIASKPTGPFTYIKRFLAASPVNGSGDFALYQEKNGDLYHICVRKSDRIMVKAKMSDDYLNPATDYLPMYGVAANTEAPAIVYNNGLYHLLGSGSSGWNPNPARYYRSATLDGPWEKGEYPCHGINPISGVGADKTFGGQSTYIVHISGTDNQYIAMFDVWKPADPINSTYVWLPFKIIDNNISINWIIKWNLTWFISH